MRRFTLTDYGGTEMNTELTFAVTATVLLVMAVVLTFKFAPRRRELFMFDLVNATFGPERPAVWRPAAPALMSRGRRYRRAMLAECRVADRAEPIQTAEWFERIGARAKTTR
jgi:hypothetical protein